MSESQLDAQDSRMLYGADKITAHRSPHDQVYQEALMGGSRSSKRNSVRSVRSSSRRRALDGHSLPYLHIQICRLSRTCDVEFLERMVPSRGPKDAADKETELLKRLLQYIDENPDVASESTQPYTRSGVVHQDPWQNGDDLDPEAAGHALKLSSASASGSSDPALAEGGTAGIQESLNTILRELRRCEASKSLTPSFKQYFILRRGNRLQESKEFAKCVKKNIKIVENMMPEASGLGHHDLALLMNHASDSIQRDISSVLNRGGKASEIPWDMLHLQTAQVMAEVKSKWELAAEARNSFQSFAQVCVAKYIQQRKAKSQKDKYSDVQLGGSENGVSGQQNAWKNFQDAHRAASTIGKARTEGSGASLKSFYRDTMSEPASSDYHLPFSTSSYGERKFGRVTKPSSRMDPDEQMSLNIARWGGDRAATTDLVSRIRALSPTSGAYLSHIHEED